MARLLTFLDVGFLFVGLVIVRRLRSRKTAGPLPPGPKKNFLLGNLLDMPSNKQWTTFAAWGEQWGNIVSVSVFGQQMIILSSAKTASEMLDKKGSIYSDRPVMEMGGEMVGWKNTLVLLRYGERLRNYRRLFHRLIGSQHSMSQFYHVEETEAVKFLRRLLSAPQNLAEHVRKTAGAIILRISHGYEVQEDNDPFVRLANIATEQFSLSTAPGTFLVNLVPALSKLPDWLPGAGFKNTARQWASTLNQMIESPYQYVKDQMASGTAPPSFTAKLLEEPNLTPEKEFDIKWSAGSLYSAGADTVSHSVHTPPPKLGHTIYAFFKAIAIYPEVAAAAQAEIDSVVGTDRLPSFSDRSNLPFVNALVLEVLRWHSVAPLGMPHVVMEDDIHDGYFIPKGSLVIPNIWKMLHDPKVYSDPMRFNPHRFLGPNSEPDPRQACFGFGRRICPGRIMAEDSIFISCAMTLAAFNVSKYEENGQVIDPIVDQTTGTISHPVAFKCSIKPRSGKALTLINSGI